MLSAQSCPPLYSFFFPAEVVKEIEKMVPHVVDMLEGPDLLDRSSAVTALGEISKQRK